MNFDFERCRFAMACRLVNVRTDMRYLSKVPFEPAFADMALTACVLTHNKRGESFFPVTNALAEKWNLQTDQLMEIAKHNMYRILTPKVYSMKDLMLSEQNGSVYHKVETMLRQRYPGTENEALKKVAGHIAGKLCEKYEAHNGMSQMWVLSNRDWTFGASGLLYSRVLETFARDHQGSFYILPSSTHEVLLIPERYAGSLDKMREILRIANVTALESRRFLSDCVYYYDVQKQEIRCV